MNTAQIEDKLQKLINSYTEESFIYELLLAFNTPKASITRLKKGNMNLSKVEGEISWKKKLFFKVIKNKDLHHSIDDIAKDAKTINHNQRFIVVTDFKTILAVDTKTDDKLDIAFTELPKHYDFFLPWAGMEKAQHQNENPADVKAAERMAKLFDEIKKDNPKDSPELIHNLNVFLSRLLFCFFAEDTHIFEDTQFTNGISSHTQEDGSDLDSYLDKLFDVFNKENKKRKNLPAYLDAFPYVNGGLFGTKIKSPKFTRRSRKAIIESGELDWSAINPDIFGSMMQAVITPEHRGGLGMHYTSVPNIMKVIEPLFLNDLNEEFEKGEYEPKKLNSLLKRISKLKIFDPACGSGNFLIIAYKEIRKLEIKIIKQLQTLQKAATGFDAPQLEFIPKTQLTLAATYQIELFSRVQLSKFYGIEIDDFAHEIAKLSLWLAEHQMNIEFKDNFGKTKPTLPLKDAGHIVHGNATRLQWEKICPIIKNDEIYLLGNPPYLGARLQSRSQKAEMKHVFKGLKGFNNLDYIASWFLKGSDYIKKSNSKFAFVTTNSISQGEQVTILWPEILNKKLEINFVHQSFKWTNNAKGNAAVIVAIIGVSNILKHDKIIYKDGISHKVKSISTYLIPGNNTFIQKRMKPLSKLPDMTFGSMANDGGNLLLSVEDKNALIAHEKNVNKFIKALIGSQEFIRGIEKYCIWIEDAELKEALRIPEIAKRIEAVRLHRENSKREATQKLADESHKFGEVRYLKTNSIIVPRVSSERRDYIPVGFLNKSMVISDSALSIYNAEPWHLGLLSSKIHMAWVKTVAGRLKTDYRYSASLCYNTFPFPSVSKHLEDEITQCIFRILEEREKYSEKTLAQLYDPDKMPEGLREAHRLNDLAIERCYRSKPFESDEERLVYLFKLYEKMIEEEKNKNTFFAEAKKPKKTRKKKK